MVRKSLGRVRRTEEKKKEERSMEETYKRKLGPEPKARRPQGPAGGV